MAGFQPRPSLVHLRRYCRCFRCGRVELARVRLAPVARAVANDRNATQGHRWLAQIKPKAFLVRVFQGRHPQNVGVGFAHTTAFPAAVLGGAASARLHPVLEAVLVRLSLTLTLTFTLTLAVLSALSWGPSVLVVFALISC